MSIDFPPRMRRSPRSGLNKKLWARAWGCNDNIPAVKWSNGFERINETVKFRREIPEKNRQAYEKYYWKYENHINIKKKRASAEAPSSEGENKALANKAGASAMDEKVNRAQTWDLSQNI